MICANKEEVSGTINLASLCVRFGQPNLMAVWRRGSRPISPTCCLKATTNAKPSPRWNEWKNDCPQGLTALLSTDSWTTLKMVDTIKAQELKHWPVPALVGLWTLGFGRQLLYAVTSPSDLAQR